eukprot:CCRYP_018346-RA/>CCRYP_018346-RA protein AED:0.51 eAED:0.44 QI:0/-1/0/1/-1/1/1/0/256
MTQTLQLLDYLATQEEAVLTYHASDMVLTAHSDASYLSEPQARSQAGGHFFLSSNADIPPNNGAILNNAHIIKHIMASTTEAKLAALFITACEAVYIRIILMELSHKQPATPLQTDNAMAQQSPMEKYNPNAPRPWICASTGYAIANAKNNFEYIGALATATMWITGQSITRPNITSTYAVNSSRRWLYSRCYAKSATPNDQLPQLHNLPFLSIPLHFEFPQGCDDTILWYPSKYRSTRPMLDPNLWNHRNSKTST